MLFLEGLPLFCLELGIGQKMRQGSVGTFSSINPYLGGVGEDPVIYRTELDKWWITIYNFF